MHSFFCLSFFLLSLSLRADLIDFKERRVAAFKKNFVDLVELELKHAKVSWCKNRGDQFQGSFWTRCDTDTFCVFLCTFLTPNLTHNDRQKDRQTDGKLKYPLHSLLTTCNTFFFFLSLFFSPSPIAGLRSTDESVHYIPEIWSREFALRWRDAETCSRLHSVHCCAHHSSIV